MIYDKVKIEFYLYNFKYCLKMTEQNIFNLI